MSDLMLLEQRMVAYSEGTADIFDSQKNHSCPQMLKSKVHAVSVQNRPPPEISTKPVNFERTSKPPPLNSVSIPESHENNLQ